MQNLIDLGFALHGNLPPDFLCEWNDLPPAAPIRQAGADGGGRCRYLVMGKEGGQRWRSVGGAILQHLAAIRGGRSAMAVTRLGIHDNVISPRFPSPIFCGKAFRFQHKVAR
jgi:hypothetical protein